MYFIQTRNNIAPKGLAELPAQQFAVNSGAESDVQGILVRSAAMQRRNEAKAALLYDYLDASRFFKNPVEKPFRSMMNVTFTSPSPELDKAFCAGAAQNGLVNLKGHRSVGGMRASIYNAMPMEGVQALVDFMQKFEAQHR